MSKWTDNDTSEYSGDSTSKVSEAEHDARDDAEDFGCFERGDDEKNKTPFSKDGLPDGGAGSFWDSIFKK